MDYLPQWLILVIAGQVLSRTIIRLCLFIYDILAKISVHHPIPTAILTPWVVGLDTSLERKFSLLYVLVNAFITLGVMYTPETLLGLWASGRTQIRAGHSYPTSVELGPVGGAYNKKNYYTSGQLLLSSITPDESYQEIGYRVEDGWMIPRKPTIWYTHFAMNNKTRFNDYEPRISVEQNEAIRIRRVANDGVVKCDEQYSSSSFNFTLQMRICAYGTFQFTFHGPDVTAERVSFFLEEGIASVQYSSISGRRVVQGSDLQFGKALRFPRGFELWASMGHCFLNAVSFLRPLSKISVWDRIAISSLVRIAWLHNEDGFRTPARMAEAHVADVAVTNIPTVLVVLLAFCCGFFAFDWILEWWFPKIGSFALADLIIVGQNASGLADDSGLGKVMKGCRWIRMERGSQVRWRIGEREELRRQDGSDEGDVSKGSSGSEWSDDI